MTNVTPLFSVITPSVGRESLFLACQSIIIAAEYMAEKCPEINVLVQHVIILDGPESIPKLDLSNLHKTSKVIVNLTATDKKMGRCGSIGRSVGTSSLAAGEYVMYLDDDNWFEPEVFYRVHQHITNNKLDWAFFFRNMLRNDSTDISCPDICESLGTLSDKCWNGSKSFIDTNCYVLKTSLAKELAPKWILPANQDRGEDRIFYEALISETRAKHWKQMPLFEFLVNYVATKDLFYATAIGMTLMYGEIMDVNAHPVVRKFPKALRDKIAAWNSHYRFERDNIYVAKRDAIMATLSSKIKMAKETHIDSTKGFNSIHFMIVPTTEMSLFETVQFAREYYEAKGIKCTVSPQYYRPTPETLVVVVGALKLRADPEYHVQSTVIWNMEHLYDESVWMSNDLAYRSILTKYKVWDFNETNVKYLVDKLGKKREDISLVKLGFCKRLVYEPLKEDEQPSDEENYDVIFYGGLNHRRNRRREAIVNKLEGTKYKFNYHCGTLLGEEKRKTVLSAKIILNMHLYNALNFESTRVIHALHNGCFVISETSNDDKEYENLADGFVRVDTTDVKGLADAVLKYLENDEERKTIAAKGREIVSSMKTEFPDLKSFT